MAATPLNVHVFDLAHAFPMFGSDDVATVTFDILKGAAVVAAGDLVESCFSADAARRALLTHGVVEADELLETFFNAAASHKFSTVDGVGGYCSDCDEGTAATASGYVLPSFVHAGVSYPVWLRFQTQYGCFSGDLFDGPATQFALAVEEVLDWSMLLQDFSRSQESLSRFRSAIQSYITR